MKTYYERGEKIHVIVVKVGYLYLMLPKICSIYKQIYCFNLLPKLDYTLNNNKCQQTIGFKDGLKILTSSIIL